MKEKYKQKGIIKIGYLDIETSGLTADFDIMLSYAIYVRNTQDGTYEIRHNVVRKTDFALALKEEDADLIDKWLVEKLIEDISDIDCLIGHWFIGKHRHDMPFIRTRAAINRIKGLPIHKTIRYGDTQKWGSLLYRLHSNGLESIGNMFNVTTQKTKLKPKIWKNACIGVRSALDYILDHNIKDVILTAKVHKGMEEFVPLPATYA